MTPSHRCLAQSAPTTTVSLTGTVDYNSLRQLVDDNPSLRSLDLSATDMTTLPAYSLAASSIEELILPQGLKTIADGALAGSQLRHITIPSSVTVIASYAFSGCKALERIDGGESLQVIGEGAMRRCTALSSFAFPATLDSIAPYALRGSALTTIDMSACKKLRTIGDWAFADCKSLEYVSTPSSLSYIGRGAFFGDINLKYVELSSDMLSVIDDFAFAYNMSLSDINAVKLSNVPELGLDTWHNIDQQATTLTIVESMLNSFASTPGWQEFNIVCIASLNTVKADSQQLSAAFAGDRLNITASAAVQSVVVYDTEGRVRLSASTAGTASPYAIDAASLTSGIYIVAVCFDNGNIAAVKARK